MRFKLYILILIQIICTTTIIKAAFKDFVIENENDLQRFGISSADEDFEYLDESIYEDDGIYRALGESCGSYDEDIITDSYDIFQGQNNAIMGDLEGKIDGNMLREILRHLANDPRFQHLKDHLVEDNLLVEYNVGNHNENYLTYDYADNWGNDQNYWSDDE